MFVDWIVKIIIEVALLPTFPFGSHIFISRQKVVQTKSNK